MSSPVSAQELRLAVFSDTALPQMNGVSRTLDRLVQTVRARGGAVRLFTTTDPTADDDDPDVMRFASAPFWAYPQLRLALPSSATAAGALQAWGATLVHAATPFGVGLAARGAALDLGLPLVTSYHTSLSAYARFYKLGALAEPGWAFLRWFHNSGRRTYCPTHAIERELREQGFARTAVWGRGVDTARFHPRWRSSAMRARMGAADDGGDRIVVAYVGRLAAEKGLDVALDAMRGAHAAAPGGFAFAFAGDGPYAEQCREHAPPGALFAGQLVGDELSAFYASADVFVFPSTTDTFGNVLLEAMSSGLAVIGADMGPTREVLGAAGGVTFPAGDGAALGELLIALAGDAERRGALAQGGLANARARSWDRIFDALIADYLDVVRERRASDDGDGRRPAPFRGGRAGRHAGPAR